MDPSQLDITAVIAIYAAFVATMSLGASIWLGIAELNRHKARLKIAPNTGVLSDAMDHNSEPLVIVEATNMGAGRLHITGVGWCLRGGRRAQFIQPYMLAVPFDLDERKRATFYFACRWLRENEDIGQIVGAFFKDETGKEWKCRIPPRKLRRWAGMTSTGWLIQWDPQLRMYFRQDGLTGPRIPLAG